uniref:Ribosomal RNA-processing protein 42 n=1 Tax=Acrobeloides nanus TaxID=290746 RepID=A0A914DGJ6_9BILA
MNVNVSLSNGEKNYIIDGVQDGMRADGRGHFDYRPIFIESGVLATTDGSARIRIGTTDVLVGIKAELATVENTQEAVNRIKFFVDFSANATPQFEGRGGESYALEIANTLYEAYNNDNVLPDLSKLILSKTHMWVLYADIVLLQYGGNIMDAASLGVRTALADTKLVNVVVRPADEGKLMVDLPDERKLWSLDVSKVPLVVEASKIGDVSVVDATIIEENCATSSLFVGIMPPECDYNPSAPSVSDDDCVLTLVRKSKGGSLELESIEEMINTGVRAARELNKALIKRLNEEVMEPYKPTIHRSQTFLH